VSEDCDVIMAERVDGVSRRRRQRMPMSVFGVLQGLPGILVSRQVILFSLLLADTMGMRGAVVQFGGSLMILVMGSVVITSGHI